MINGVEEFAKLAAAMAPVTFADDCACLHIQSGEQGRRAVAFVIVAAAFDLAGPHGQQRLGPIQRLHL